MKILLLYVVSCRFCCLTARCYWVYPETMKSNLCWIIYKNKKNKLIFFSLKLNWTHCHPETNGPRGCGLLWGNHKLGLCNVLYKPQETESVKVNGLPDYVHVASSHVCLSLSSAVNTRTQNRGVYCFYLFFILKFP